MSLFNQLRRLYRPDRFQLEDFHTEIVAQVLRNSKELTLKWLFGIELTTLLDADHIYIQTQDEFAALEGHSSASRPDITIRIVADGKTELIFIESKITSVQGDDQLQRYMEHLEVEAKRTEATKSSLVFITHNYEAASEELMGDKRFVPTRWFRFYHYLKDHVNGDGLAKELKLFMEENRMSLPNQFKPNEIDALETFLSARALMDETLEGEVTDKIKTIFGDVWRVSNGGVSFRDEGRYVVSNRDWNDIECHVGYWLYATPDKPVDVGITIYSKANSAARKDVIAAFRGWLKKPGVDWLAEELDDERAMSAIYKVQPLRSFAGEANNVQAIKVFLLSLLKELEVFRSTYPNIP